MPLPLPLLATVARRWMRSRLGRLAVAHAGDPSRVADPYHHKPVSMYQHNLSKLPPAACAEVLLQFADARERLYATFAAVDVAHPTVSNDLETGAVALLEAGERERAAEVFEDAAARFAAFFGASSADAARCMKATTATSVQAYKELCAAG